MKKLIAAMLFASPFVCAQAFAAVEPATPVAEIKIRKTQEKTPEPAPEQELAQEATRTSIDVLVRLRTSWADIRVRINI